MSQPVLVAEFRPSWGSRFVALVCAVAVLALPSVVFLVDHIVQPWLWWAILMLPVGGMIVPALADDFTLRISFHGDRLERVRMGRRRSIQLRDIKGLRLTDEGIHIIPEDHAGKRFSIPRSVAKDPAVVAWLEGLRNLDAEDYNKEAAELEADDRLGLTVPARRQAMAGLRRIASVLSFAGFGIALWALLFPRPLEVVTALCVGAPVVAILFAFVRPDAVQLLLGNNETPAAGVSGLWFTPAIAIALPAMRYTLIDLRASMIIALAPAALFLGASLLADRRLRGIVGAIFVLVIGYAWGWGGLVVANALFDTGRPVVVEGRVTSASRPDDRDPTITVVSPDLSHPIEDIAVSKERLKALPVGTKAYLMVFPGRLGWRYAYLADAPSPLVTRE